MTTNLLALVKEEIDGFIADRDACAAMVDTAFLRRVKSKGSGHRFGTPPFILLKDDDAMGVVDAKARFHALPYGYRPDEDCIDHTRFDAVYACPGPRGSILRLLPVDKEFTPPALAKTALFENSYTEMDEQAWQRVDEGFGVFTRELERRAKVGLIQAIATATHGLAELLELDADSELAKELSAGTGLLAMMTDGDRMLNLLFHVYSAAIKAVGDELSADDDDEDDDEDDEEYDDDDED